MSDMQDRLRKALADHYHIECELASGGMAIVYLAHDVKRSRKVAVKVLRPELAAAVGSERFLREIQIAAGLNHPNILQVYDSGEAAGLLYYVMPLAEGESLRDKLTSEKQLSADEAMRITREVAEALGYAHEQGVVHRDIKPENILLHADHAQVADFGVAKAVSGVGEAQLTETGFTVGTPSYMSPEQAAGEQTIDGRSDIYSLGCVLYEMLAGQPPFTGPSAQSVVSQHISATPPNIDHIRPGLPPSLGHILERSLAKTPADRFRSFAEFSSVEISATRPIATRRPPKRPRLPITLAGFAALVAIVVFVVPKMFTGEAADPSGGVAILPFVNLGDDRSLDRRGIYMADQMAGVLSRHGVIQVVSPGRVFGVLPHGAAVRAAEADGELEAAAASLAADLVVTGSFYQRNDSTALQAELRSADGEVLHAAEVVVAADPYTATIGAAADIGGAVAFRFSRLGRNLQNMLLDPPALDAWVMLMDGSYNERRNRYDIAEERYRQAIALDSTFLGSYVALASGVLLLSRRVNEIDSLYAVVQSMTVPWTDRQRGQIDYLEALANGWHSAAYEAVARMGNLPSLEAFLGLMSNRPHDAVRAYRRSKEVEPLVWDDWFPPWHHLAKSLHLTSSFDEELDLAREGRGRWPTLRGVEMRALLAVNRLDSLPAFIRDPTGDLFTLLYLAKELKAHGHEMLADSALHVIVRRVRALRPVDRDEWEHHTLGAALIMLGHGADGTPIFRALHAESPGDLRWLGHLGVARALERDSAEVEAILDTLARRRDKYLFGIPTLWRARIEAVRGNEETAIALLALAFEQGMAINTVDGATGNPNAWPEADPHFHELRDNDQFRAIMRPKGGN